MDKTIVVLNAGSSSLKFSALAVDGEKLNLLVRGQVEGLGTHPRFKAKRSDGQEFAEALTAGRVDQHEAFTFLLQWLRQQFPSGTTLVGVGHRVVHGGADFAEPTRLNPEVVERLDAYVPLAPLHQPHNLSAIKSLMQLRPDVPQVACFDTAFHHGRARVTQRFGLPDELFHRGVRRWGFHGLSYESIAKTFRRLAPDLAGGRIIAAHLGSGASLCAMTDGRSIDTTMSFSVLDGLPMGTRCGGLDPGVILFLLREGWTLDRIEDLLYKKSGLLGISGVSNDVRDLLASQDPRAAEAIEYFVYRIVREIGSLTAALGGLDALIFTAGVGENSPDIRQRVCAGLEWLNVRIEADANRQNARCISAAGQKPSVWVIPTDEEGVIASHTLAVVQRRRASAPPH
jgi:acetate kinase